MAETITNIRDLFQLFETNLETAVGTLDQKDRIGFEYLKTLDGYNLAHPRGVYGLLFNGAQYSRDERIKSNTIVMKNDLMIGVVSIIRYFDVPNAPLEDQPMMPVEYAELAVDTMSGIEIENNRPEYERRIIPVRTELVDEEKGVWKYLTTFSVPRDFLVT
jgi:hypothetical protein